MPGAIRWNHQCAEEYARTKRKIEKAGGDLPPASSDEKSYYYGVCENVTVWFGPTVTLTVLWFPAATVSPSKSYPVMYADT